MGLFEIACWRPSLGCRPWRAAVSEDQVSIPVDVMEADLVVDMVAAMVTAPPERARCIDGPETDNGGTMDAVAEIGG